MPSVNVVWSGALPRGRARDALVRHIGELAAVTRRARYTLPAPVTWFAQRITGKVLVNPGLCANADLERWDGLGSVVPVMTCPEGAEEPALAVGDGIRISLGNPFARGARFSGTEQYLRLEEAWLSGVEFALPTLYGDGRVSFMFLDLPKVPALDGKLVLAENARECKKYRAPLVQGADWYINQPSIHLRYRHEPWMDLLLAWVKLFFIPELWYWRHTDLPGYRDLELRVEAALDMRRGARRSHLQSEEFEKVLRGLSDELDP